MNLSEQNVLFLDCQTSGAAPPQAQIIELGWSRKLDPQCQSTVTALEKNRVLSKRIEKITGIEAAEFQGAPPIQEICTNIFKDLDFSVPVVIHYAKFELPFLRHLEKNLDVKKLGLSETNSDLSRSYICTFEIAKRLYPNLPSKSIRAVSGYLGFESEKLKRSLNHVQATRLIWEKSVAELAKRGIQTLEDLENFLQHPAPKKTTKIYALDRQIRLSLPAKPGIYFLKSASGKILYVGKATNLKSRVNSYFRGQKTKGSRLNELVSQVSDVGYHTVASSFESAIVESDAIKSHNPPYNKALIKQDRTIAFCNNDFKLSDQKRTTLGPFSSPGFVEHVYELRKFLDGFCCPLDGTLRKALDIFRDEYLNLDSGNQIDWRKVLVKSWAESIARSKQRLLDLEQEKLDDTEEYADVEEDAEDESGENELAELTPEDMARHIAKSLAGFARRVHRARWITRLSHSDFYWNPDPSATQASWHHAKARLGIISFDKVQDPIAQSDLAVIQSSKIDQPKFDVSMYDRMSVFHTEIRRIVRSHEHVSLRIHCGLNKNTLDGAAIKKYMFPGDFL